MAFVLVLRADLAITQLDGVRPPADQDDRRIAEVLAEAEAKRLANLEALKKTTVSKPAEATSGMSKKDIFLSELAKKYPEGVTEEVDEGVNFKMLRIIIVIDGKANEYKKVTYNWGGVYYKKNDLDISEFKFKQETKR